MSAVSYLVFVCNFDRDRRFWDVSFIEPRVAVSRTGSFIRFLLFLCTSRAVHRSYCICLPVCVDRPICWRPSWSIIAKSPAPVASVGRGLYALCLPGFLVRREQQERWQAVVLRCMANMVGRLTTDKAPAWNDRRWSDGAASPGPWTGLTRMVSRPHADCSSSSYRLTRNI